MRFSFYGTLIAEAANPMAGLVREKLRPLGPASVAGSLHAVPDPDGWYPALLPGSERVHGMLYEAGEAFTAADLARLDAYEDYDSARPDASLYLRRPLQVIARQGEGCLAEAYIFNQPLPAGALVVPGGDFRGWLAEHGLRPFGE